MANELRTRFIVSSSVLMTIAVILLLLGFYCSNKANELDDEAWKDLQAGETNKYLEKSIDSNGLRYFSLIFYSVGSSVLIISIALLIIGYPKRIDPLEELSHLYLDRLVVDDDFKDKRRKELIKKMSNLELNKRLEILENEKPSIKLMN